MATERHGNTIYVWNTIRENELSSIQSWTDAAKKVREVAQDTYRIAIATAPVGKTSRIKRSHRISSFRLAGRYRAEQAVINTAPHALWVHEGTKGGPSDGVLTVFRPGGGFMGPVGYDQVRVPRGKRWAHGGSSGRAGRNGVYFRWYTFGGQGSQPWLANAGRAAYHMPGNN